LPQILVIDDDPGLLAACAIGLAAFGHAVSTAETGQEGIASVRSVGPDVVVLDMGLPDADGLEVCRAIRTGGDAPIIVLSADGSEARKVDALDLGADDYVTKPFGMRELDARIRASLRRRGGRDRPDELDLGALHFDLAHREVTRSGQHLDLTPKEFDFLAFLAAHAGKSCSRRMILDEVWGPEYRSETQYLKVYAYRLRKKLDDEQGRILTSDPAVGYRLVPPTP
jgi:two-component system KDP operon response regulator KdpE